MALIFKQGACTIIKHYGFVIFKIMGSTFSIFSHFHWLGLNKHASLLPSCLTTESINYESVMFYNTGVRAWGSKAGGVSHLVGEHDILWERT